jgi:hypothetical protein
MFGKLFRNSSIQKTSNPQFAGGDMNKIPIGRTTQQSSGGLGSIFSRLLGRSSSSTPTGSKGDYISKTFSQGFKMKDGGLVRGSGKVLKDRIKKTKYY